MPAELVPPQDEAAEDAVLGACLISAKAADHALDTIDAGWFYRESNGRIFDAVRRLRAEGVEADAISVMAELDADGKLEDAGGRARVHELACLVPTTSNLPHYAQLVRGAWLKREAIKRIGQLNELAWNGSRAEEVAAAFELAALDVAHKADTGRASTLWTGEDAAADLEHRLANPVDEEATGVATPFPFLSPLAPGRLYVLGGYSGDGKTAIAIQALRAAAESAAHVGYVTLEMTRQDLRDRLVASFGVPYNRVRTGRVMPTQRPQLERALEFLRNAAIAFVDDARTPDAIARVQRIRRFDLVIVDHLHRLRLEITKASELRVEIERAVQALTDMALAEEVPVLLLAQLHRPPGRDDFPRPTMQSFRETGKIEQEASAVWALWRKREGGQRTAAAEFLILKNRYGPDGMRPLQFRGDYVDFVQEAKE